MMASTVSVADGKKTAATSLQKGAKKTPSQLIKDQETGKSIVEQFPKPTIIQFLNISDNSIYSDSAVPVDEPLFKPEPHVIQFTNYEALQIKEQILKLSNKDKVARCVKIIPPDSKLFQVFPCKKNMSMSTSTKFNNPKDLDNMNCRVAPGMEISYVIRFSPEAKIDYAYDLMIVTEREKFIVPIRAVGCRAMLDFPDQLDFGLVPVKHAAEKPVMIRNIGEKTTKWHVKVPDGFHINKAEGIMEVGQSEQLVFQFVPQESRPYKDEVLLIYDSLEAYIPIHGESHNDNVYLSKTHIHMEDTSITLYSHQYYQIVNKSSVPVEFSWRAFATEREERDKKSRLIAELAKEEAEERMILEESNPDESQAESLDSDDSYDEDELNKRQERAQQKAIATLARKYQSICKAVEEDQMLFQDEIFSIEPLQGKIWPNTEITCCVTFKPQGPFHYSCTAFCNITCSEERLPLNMTGKGKGPHAELSMPEMDIGDVFVNYQMNLQVAIENKGEIDCHYKLIPYDTPFGSKFHFSTTEGVLGVKDRSKETIDVKFKSDILGEFSETFRFALEGSSEMKTLTYKGHVVAPTFSFSKEMIDFGLVSFLFKVEDRVTLTNTSEVEIKYKIRVPSDGRTNEFSIINDSGCLQKDESQQITIQFIPQKQGDYDMVLVVDLEGVGQDMLAVPIKARCQAPNIEIKPKEYLEFDECFLNHPKTMQITLMNDDSLPAKFEIKPQEESFKRLAEFTTDCSNGTSEIKPKSSRVINVTLETQQLGKINIPMNIQLIGQQTLNQITIFATSVGPKVETKTTELDFKQIDVLEEAKMSFQISNSSQIPAVYTAFTKNKDSPWRVMQRSGTLQPEDTQEITVVCVPDWPDKFQDTLHVVINDGVDIEINLKAQGRGTTLKCAQNLEVVDFGTKYTHKPEMLEYFLENRGRKAQRVKWERVVEKKRDPKKKKEDANQTANKTAGDAASKKPNPDNSQVSQAEKAEEEVQFAFAVNPKQEFNLQSKYGIPIQFRGSSAVEGAIEEKWVCMAASGSDRSGKMKEVWTTMIKCNFINPKLELEPKKLSFVYLWQKDVPSTVMKKQLKITNVGPLSTSITIKIDPPFSCNTETLELKTDCPQTIEIEFDPSMWQERVSEDITRKLHISHDKHPHKDTVLLCGEVCFPNLQILPPDIHFGCILNDTSKKKFLTLKNISQMPVSYEWSFLEEETASLTQKPIEEKKKGKKKKKLPINEVFDILPVSGTLDMGQSETVEFTYYAGNMLHYSGIAICSVDGGPDYRVQIDGESSNIACDISEKELDFGLVPYNKEQTKTFEVHNLGMVPFEYHINLSKLSRDGMIRCEPTHGAVGAKEKREVTVTFKAGIPDNISEVFQVECAHYAPRTISVKAVGIFPGCLLSFPRSKDDQDFFSKQEETKKLLKKEKVSYAALFKADQAVQGLSGLVVHKKGDKNAPTLKEPFSMEVEAEVDRRILCEKLITKYDIEKARTGINFNTNYGAGFASGAPDKSAIVVQEGRVGTEGTSAREVASAAKKQMNNTGMKNVRQKTGMAKSVITDEAGSVRGDSGSEHIPIATYVCEFGNVVLGRSANRTFLLTNVGGVEVSFSFDKRILNEAGISVDTEKVVKMKPNTSMKFEVKFQTRKSQKYGPWKHIVPINIVDGPQYQIRFTAFLTIPELTLSDENIDFQKVCVGTRKTIKLRLENNKEVACDWWYYFKPDISAPKDAGERFQVSPQQGILQPGQKQTVDVMFFPNNDKAFQQKLTFRCKENTKQFVVQAKGQGAYYQMECVPDKVNMGPVLPYKALETTVELVNPMDQAIEVYSLDFDKQYLGEEEIIKRHDNFANLQNGHAAEPLYLPLRQPGSEFWPHLKLQDEKKTFIEGLRRELAEIEEKLAEHDLQENKPVKDEQGEPRPEEEVHQEWEQARAQLLEQKQAKELQITEAENEALTVKYPPAVKEHERLNIILIGPEKCGKTTVANYLAQEHQRCVVRLDQLLDFALKRGLPVYERAQEYLQQRDTELQTKLAEQAKKKPKKPKPGEVVEEIDPASYKFLPLEMLVEMLRERVSGEDCGAGVIFDGLESENWAGIPFAIELICEALPTQKVQMVVFNFQTEMGAEDDEEDKFEVCTNYRLATRRLEASKGDKGDRKGDETIADVSSVKKGAKPPRRREKNAEELAKQAEEEAAEAKRREEAERKAREEQERTKLKPKDYSEEDREAYQALVKKVTEVFTSINMRQYNMPPSETASQAPKSEKPQDEEEEKKSQKPDEGAEDQEEAPKEEPIIYGSRTQTDQFIHYDFRYLCEDVKKSVPTPLWPNPDKEPLPPPETHQIIKGPPRRPAERAPVQHFSIWTPVEADQELQELAEGEEPKPEERTQQARWILQPGERKKLYVKFFSKNIGDYPQNLQFEILGQPNKTINLNLSATCDFPTINSGWRNVFNRQKKSRPQNPPESYLSRTYVVSEGVFDFGPLLIGKDPEKRSEMDHAAKEISAFDFQITNNGKFKVNANFTLKSTLPNEDGTQPEKSPFILEPENMELDIDQSMPLTVYAFPDKAQEYKDEIICLIKDNPNPILFQIRCLGQKPIVEVDQEVVEFDRLLLEKELTKTLTLKNTCAIATKWKLSGGEQLPEEFEVSRFQGTLKPCQEVQVEIKFKAIKEQKFEPKLTLEVEDTEGLGINQDPKQIELRAEAFSINLDIKLSNEEENVMDFQEVRVREPKEKTLWFKNIGMYPIKFDFQLKKKLSREIFKIEPMNGELQPNEDKNISIVFESKQEIKLRTSKNNADIVLSILEGKSGEKHQTLPIHVNVNAVFSKYSIVPLKNINFGPMQYGEQVTRSFEIRNEGLFDFKFAICDYKDQEAKQRIREQREKEMQDRINGAAEEQKEDPKAKAKKPDPKAKGKGKGKEEAPEGGLLQVSQYSVTPAQGDIAVGSSAVVNVTFKAEGAKFYENVLAIDVSGRDPQDQADGIPFEICAESSIPGINATDMDQIFEEQTVIPSLDPSKNTQTVITSSLFSIQEQVFWFGTLIASQNPEGARERFKVMNPNKIPCTVRFSVKPRTQSRAEGFAFDVKPDTLTIEPHKHKYVSVGFSPTAMMTYGGIFEAVVENGDPNSKSGKMVFELRGEGTLPTLQIDEPKEKEADGTPVIKFRKTRLGRESRLPLVLKNEGSVAATARFDPLRSEAFGFAANLTHTLTPKTYHGFDIKFCPQEAGVQKYLLTFNTAHNPYEQHKVMIVGEGYSESITFEGLPKEMEDELLVGDCVVQRAKAEVFSLVNNGDKHCKFHWNTGEHEGFKIFPQTGHLKARSSKQIKVVYKGTKTVRLDKVDLVCETSQITQNNEDGSAYKDWDDTMKTMRMVRPSEYRNIMRRREEEERKRREEAEAAALAAQKKKPAKKDKKQEEPVIEDEPVDENEEPTEELIETIPEPEIVKIEGSDKNVPLKTSLTCDYAKYDCSVKEIYFKPTLMYASRTFKFTIKNTSLIELQFNFRIVNASTGILDAGPYTVVPKKGSIAPGCDDNFLVKFSPMEVEDDFARILSANILNLDPENADPLIIEVNGIAERPVIHFELPPSSYRDRKAKDMTPIDPKYKIVEFDSLGTNIKNTRRFMAVNPTASGYEFEWEQVQAEEGKREKPLFKCLSQKGVILSGKKFEMTFEYIPENVGEHESEWLFRIPSENITQHFLVVGRVNEPNVMFETGKIKFGPLLLEGKNREVVNIINQEHIPFSFNFAKESVKGSTDYGDSLRVNPMAGVVPAQSQIPVEVLFQPKFELTYNYNLTCNVKRKARPLVLNVKGEGYKIHHAVYADVNRENVTNQHKFDFQDFFINEKKSKKVVIANQGEFNFDFVWKRQVNKYLTITPETGSVPKGSEIECEITYLPLAEHKLRDYKCQLQVISGPKYEFLLTGSARKPGVQLSATAHDFGPSFCLRQPMPKTFLLELVNGDNSAISIESSFEKKPYLDVQLAPGQVLLPSTRDNPQKLQIPIIFTPREIKKYHEVVTFDFNGLYTIDVTITGEGIPLLLDLVDPDQAFVDFGVVSVGGDVTKTALLQNKSKRPVTFQLLPSSEDAFKKNQISFMPDKEMTLKPREQKQIEVRFHPQVRLPEFSLDILLQVKDNEARKLIQVQGVSHGIEIKMMDEVIAFGSVVKGSRRSKTLQLSNFGDVKAFFKWDSKAYAKHFTITPSSGYIAPNSNLDLEVTFHPNKVDPDISYKNVRCEITGGDVLGLTLMGKCVEQSSDQTQELSFNAIVRKSDKQTISLQNPDEKEWHINPTISSENESSKGFFTGKGTLTIPAKGSAQYEIVYTPLTMTKDEQDFHRGSLFFPQPNGTALLYKLQGQAKAPDCEQELAKEVKAKKNTFVVIPVRNWLKTAQRFTVSWEVEGGQDTTTFIRGANTFDVAGDSSKDYKLNFLTYKAALAKVIVTFKNEASGEFMFYRLNVTSTEPDLIEELELASPVRESVMRIISIENPTENEVEINKNQWVMANEYLDIQPEVLRIPPKSERGFEVHYRPLITSEQTCDLELKSPVLGNFKYKLVLKGLVPSTQKSMAFKCSLGGETVQSFKFHHYMKKATNYAVKVEKLEAAGPVTDFKADVAQVQAQAADSYAGVECSVNVKYEPFNIGDSRAILKLVSPEGIEYSCLLYGYSQAPQPQGPIKCAPGGKPAVDFKNPLNEKCEFQVTFDNPNFSLASKPPGPLDPGKSTSLQIKFDNKPDHPATGRMIVSTKSLPPWIYYLSGE